MSNDDIAHLLKFAPKEAHIDNLLNGRLYMNAAGRNHDLPHKQGDPLKASLACGMGIFANWLLSIYRIFTERESDIVNNTVVITRRMIDEFRCAEGWISIVRYGCFERLLDRAVDSGKDISLHRPVYYGAPGPSVTDAAFQGTPYNLIIKTPKYAYQREYRNYRPASKAHAAMKASATKTSCRGNVKGPLPEKPEQRPFFVIASLRAHDDCITENILPQRQATRQGNDWQCRCSP